MNKTSIICLQRIICFTKYCLRKTDLPFDKRIAWFSWRFPTHHGQLHVFCTGLHDLHQRLDCQLNSTRLIWYSLFVIVLLEKLPCHFRSFAYGISLVKIFVSIREKRTIHSKCVPEGSDWYRCGVPSWLNPTINVATPNGRRPLLCVYFCFTWAVYRAIYSRETGSSTVKR